MAADASDSSPQQQQQQQQQRPAGSGASAAAAAGPSAAPRRPQVVQVSKRPAVTVQRKPAPVVQVVKKAAPPLQQQRSQHARAAPPAASQAATGNKRRIDQRKQKDQESLAPEKLKTEEERRAEFERKHKRRKLVASSDEDDDSDSDAQHDSGIDSKDVSRVRSSGGARSSPGSSNGAVAMRRTGSAATPPPAALPPRNCLSKHYDDADVRPTVSSEDLTRLNLSLYEHYFVDTSDTQRPVTEWAGADMPFVELEYPGLHASERFLLMHSRKDDEYAPISDLIETVRFVLDHFFTSADALAHFGYASSSFTSFLAAPSPARSRSGTPQQSSSSSTVDMPIMRTLERARARKDGPLFLEAVSRYNAKMRELKRAGVVRSHITTSMPQIPERLWTKISDQTYERTVGPQVERLGKYEAFSDNVYGELLPRFIADVLRRTRLAPNSVFVDLGSGVGNCVLQAALATGCEAHGFENMPLAASLAQAQVEEARKRAAMWGLDTGEMHVREADFCNDEEVGKVLRRADVVLVNNEVFSASLNQRLALLFLELRTGAQIVSLKAFAPPSFKLTEHTRDSPLAIIEQGRELTYARESVSWKEEGGTFFIAKVDRERVERFLTSTS